MKRSIAPPECRITSDGELVIAATCATLPNYHFIREIARGANAIVFLARHTYLERDTAIKVWMTLRTNDRRDKFRQGLEEARKAERASRADDEVKAIHIYDGGEIRGHFFMAMQYFPSISLRDWLAGKRLLAYVDGQGMVALKQIVNGQPSLGLRWNMAKKLVYSSLAAARAMLIHGDLHPGNVLVGPDELGRFLAHDFRIVDYGTSLFTSKGFSQQRHWKVLDETVSKLLYPFDMKDWCSEFTDLAQSPALTSAYVNAKHMQYVSFLFRISETAKPDTGRKVSLPGGVIEDRLKCKPKHHRLFEQLVRSGALLTDHDHLGGPWDWDTDGGR